MGLPVSGVNCTTLPTKRYACRRNSSSGKGVFWMLPTIGLPTSRLATVDADDVTRKITPLSVNELIDAFEARSVLGGGGDVEDGDVEMRKEWTGIIQKLENLKTGDSATDALDAELLILTTETDEGRAGELLDLGEKLLLRVLGNVRVVKTDVNVVTSQPTTSATLNLYERGVRIALLAYGAGNTPVKEFEDFLASRAITEFQLLLLRFLNTDTLKHENVRLKMHMQPTGRVLDVQRIV